MHGDAKAMVSVIVPIYNVERYLAQCLESILGQSHANLEVICINDGSTDSSLSIIRSFAARDARVVVVDKKNEGYGAGCNKGIELARGEWVSIVEPDDWIEPTMYQEMLALADSMEEVVDIVKTPWTNINLWDDPARQFASPSILTHRLRTSREPFTIAEHTVLMELHPSIWSAIYRTDFIRERGISFMPIPGAGWADNPFLVETLCQARAIVYLDKPFYNYRCDLPGSTLHHKTVEAIERPFVRWLDMLAVIERLSITDRRIISAHYLRGFNYVYGAIYDDGWDNPVVKERTREVFGHMDPDLVVKIRNLAPHRKRFYYDVMGLPCPRIPLGGWIAHLAREATITLRVEGPARVFGRVGRVLHPEERATA